MYECANIRVYMYARVRVSKCACVRVCEYASEGVRQCTNVRVCNVRVYVCASV